MSGRPQADDHLTDKRPEPPLAGGELATLVGFLDYQRQTALLKCADLTPAQLITAASPPATLNLLGILRHLVLVERGWLVEVFAGEPEVNLFGDAVDADFEVTEADPESVAATFALYAEQVARSNEIIAGTGPESLSVVASERSGERFSLRWILTHLIEEYARHNGHGDLLREAVDGVTGE